MGVPTIPQARPVPTLAALILFRTRLWLVRLWLGWMRA